MQHARQEDARHQLGPRLFRRALLRGRFVLRSGEVSDRYFDKFRVTTDPLLLEDVADAMHELLTGFAPDAELLVAPELGAVPLATALSLRSAIPFVIVRSEGKQYGTARRIEGEFAPNQPAVLVEDVVTSGGAALEALATARAAGIRVERSLCLLDRGGAGAHALDQAGAPLHALFGPLDIDRAIAAGDDAGAQPTDGEDGG